MSLKYRFTAQYKDGSIYQQNKDDISVVDPSRSCFYDVDVDRLFTFTLENEQGFFTVNLEDGSFTTNAAGSFCLHGEIVPNKKLVYFRRVIKDFVEGEEVGGSITYFLGWKGEVDGKEIQYTIRIS